MAKKRSPSSPNKLDQAEGLKVAALRDEGNKLFAKKEYEKAMTTYDKAIKLVPEGASDRALLHNNKAACLMMLQRYKESVKECSSALSVQPNYHKALIRRSKAYEKIGHLKEALEDVRKVNKSEYITEETQETEKRLRDIMAGKVKAAPVASNGAGRKSGGSGKGGRALIFAAKCTLDDETRMLHMSQAVTYAELLDGVRQKFPTAGPFMLKYLDREGDLVTITDKNDIHKAMQEAIDHMERMQSSGGSGARLPQNALPALRITLVRCKESEVPPPPQEEAAYVAQQLKQIEAARRMMQAQAQQKQQQELEAAKSEQQPQEVYQFEPWLIDFANLFRDMLNVDPERHLDLQELGWDKCQEGLDAALAHDKALPLFEQAADKFAEVTATGLCQWGNVYMCIARRIIDTAAKDGSPLADALPKVVAEHERAEKRFNEALGYKADFWDAAVALAQMHFDRAKLEAGFLVKNPTQPELAADADEAARKAAQEAAVAAQNKASADALAKLKMEDAAKAEPFFKAASDKYAEAVEMLSPEERAKEMKPAPEAPAEAAPEQEEANFFQQTLIFWGNLLYEHSQIRAATGGDWKPLIDEAVAKFRQAKCSESDIRAALLNHSMKEQIDIPEEPKKAAPAPEAPATPSTSASTAAKPASSAGAAKQANGPAAAAEKKEEVKGLPSLGPKPKGGKK
ncbi:hypothetical protein WJX72_002137 [[Myrmecia] bisecta]|uniref:PB1 domain-containing protein n=1 Tax=[Myrmecia] bisecta TaxID=41462 RepID=A0AAW1PN62_9CHLO